MSEDQKTKDFIEAYGKLRQEYQMDFISIPTFQPTERGTWELKIVPQVMSTEEQPTPSPFMA